MYTVEKDKRNTNKFSKNPLYKKPIVGLLKVFALVVLYMLKGKPNSKLPSLANSLFVKMIERTICATK